MKSSAAAALATQPGVTVARSAADLASQTAVAIEANEPRILVAAAGKGSEPKIGLAPHDVRVGERHARVGAEPVARVAITP